MTAPFPDQPIFLPLPYQRHDQQCTLLIILTGGLTAGPAVSSPLGIADGEPLSAALCISEPLPPSLPAATDFFCGFQATLPPRGGAAVGWGQQRRRS